jgi:UDP-N-acetylglucosamine--N-acetylmuramyl-(pentapeptide) pyrophosphoryl-undecaprenol N-acetylglucosamine transferase
MKILAVTGSSGGHIFPAVSFISALKNRRKDINTLLVLPKRCLKAGITIPDCGVKYISTRPLSLKLSSENLISSGRFIQGSFESLKIILGFKPDIVVGFGSLDSIPSLFFAWLFRIPAMIHEQNVLPGKANRLLARLVDKAAISFPETKSYLKIDPQKIALTGNPLRERLKIIDKKAALDFFGLSPDKFTVLVMGGSQGSRHLNAGFLKAAQLLKNTAMIQVIHLAGRGDLEEIKGAYKKMNIAVRVFDIFNETEQAYSASDLVISRSGATTIAELSYFRLPAILSPYPYAYNHQLENAKVLRDKGCAVIINDDELDRDTLGVALESIIADRDKLKNMRSGFAGLAEFNSADRLAEAALSLYK